MPSEAHLAFINAEPKRMLHCTHTERTPPLGLLLMDWMMVCIYDWRFILIYRNSFHLTGLLYITEDPDDSTTNVAPLTWDLASITGECWIANATFVNGTTAGSMFIEQNNTIGVLPITRIANVNGTVTGFALFASQLVYNNNTELEAQFWAKSTSKTGVYGLVWTPDGDTPTGDFPVVVKASEDS